MTPSGERSGREPTEARSARGLRIVYAVIALVIGLAAGIWLWSIRPGSGEEGGTAFAVAALSCLLVALVSAIDLVQLLVRRARSGSDPRR